MSKVKTDTSLWLHNKLGNVNDLWSSGSICSQLNCERLKNIRDCFTDLQPLVKLKLLISFLHIPRSKVDEWKNELKDIIEVAILDSDQWVSMVGELLKIYPQKGTINFDIEENSAVFNDLINELKKLVKKHNDQGILPIECLYLNKNALNSIIGSVPLAIKHFNLKKNPKSITLRSDLLQKSNDAALNLKRGNLGQPIRNRSGSKDLNDQTPLKGIPRSLNSSQFKMPTIQNRLQIGTRNPTRPSMPGVRKDVGIKFLDQPVSLPDSKKKKKVEKESAESSANKSSKENDKSNNIEQTPTYADYVPPSPAVHSSTYDSNQQQDKQSTNNSYEPQPQQTTSFQTNLPTSSLPQMPYTQQLDTSSTLINNPADLQFNPSTQITSSNSLQQQSQQQTQSANEPTTAKVVRTLNLSRQQAEEIRQICSLYPVERGVVSMILNFMGGNRVNPNQNDEDILRVRLGEKREIARQPDGTLVQIISDAWYQMNYRTGESFEVNTNKRINPNVHIQPQPPSIN